MRSYGVYKTVHALFLRGYITILPRAQNAPERPKNATTPISATRAAPAERERPPHRTRHDPGIDTKSRSNPPRFRVDRSCFCYFFLPRGEGKVEKVAKVGKVAKVAKVGKVVNPRRRPKVDSRWSLSDIACGCPLRYSRSRCSRSE